MIATTSKGAVKTHIEDVGVNAMNKAMLESRRKMMEEKMKDPHYRTTSYERQMKKKKETYIDDRQRVA